MNVQTMLDAAESGDLLAVEGILDDIEDRIEGNIWSRSEWRRLIVSMIEGESRRKMGDAEFA